MELNQFERHVAKLKSVYGERIYPDERVDTLWGSFKEMGSEEFEKLISHIINTYQRPPMPTEIKTISYVVNREFYEERKRKYQERISSGEVDPCRYCENSGLLTATWIHSETTNGFSFRCSFCNSQERIKTSKIIPLWGSSFKKNYLLDTDRITEITTNIKKVSDVMNSIFKTMPKPEEDFKCEWCNSTGYLMAMNMKKEPPNDTEAFVCTYCDACKNNGLDELTKKWNSNEPGDFIAFQYLEFKNRSKQS